MEKLIAEIAERLSEHTTILHEIMQKVRTNSAKLENQAQRLFIVQQDCREIKKDCREILAAIERLT